LQTTLIRDRACSAFRPPGTDYGFKLGRNLDEISNGQSKREEVMAERVDDKDINIVRERIKPFRKKKTRKCEVVEIEKGCLTGGTYTRF